MICLFVCCFTSQVNSYGHGGTVSSHSHTFFLGKLEQAVNQYFVHILSLVTDNNQSITDFSGLRNRETHQELEPHRH